MTIEVTAKKVDEAISQGLKQLGASLDEVDVEVLDAGGLFRKAKVRLTLEREEKAEPVKEQKPEQKAESKKPESKPEHKPAQKPERKAEPKAKPAPEEKAPVEKPTEKPVEKRAQKQEERKPQKPAAETVKAPRTLTEDDKLALKNAQEFVKTVVEKMGFEDVDIKPNANGEIIELTAKEGDDSLLIGRHGETLSALSYLAETCARAEKHHINVTVDCNGYRDRRAASLTAMARRRANECVAKHRKIKLEPMERVDRRTIHNALTDDERVSTASEGKEPRRYVVIIPKNNG